MKNIKGISEFILSENHKSYQSTPDGYILIGKYTEDQAPNFFIDVREIEDAEDVRFYWNCLEDPGFWSKYMENGNVIYLAKGPNGYLSAIMSPEGRIISAVDQNNKYLNPQELDNFKNYISSI